jgi:hypothetical protein
MGQHCPAGRAFYFLMKPLVVLFVLVGIPLSPAWAQQDGHDASGLATASAATVDVAAGGDTTLELPFEFDGPAPPALPTTMARDEEGRTTVRAIRLSAPLRVDGQLDEAIYRSITPITDFIQVEPGQGTPATEKTEVWIAFDSDNVYVAVRASESQPERMIVNEMRRDSNQIWQNEHFGVAFDTFYDRRNSMNFYLNPIGGRADGQVTNEGQYNGDWNPVWAFKVRRSANGWTGEMAIPFKSMRYRAGRSQIWGVQMRRTNRWKNEHSYLTHLPDGSGLNGMFRMSYAATLVGIEVPGGPSALDIKPYAISDLSSDLTANPAVRNNVGKDFGVDLKYGVTQGLAADLTYNTDFAQVEADEQQVNLTRFSLFFPEKRDFFLENQGIFNFGGVNANNANFSNDSPVLFYSRRIGLDQGHEIPIEAGGRLTGRVGRYSIGVVNMQTEGVERFGAPSTNFTVARVKRDILKRSAIGVLATQRSNISGGTGPGTTVGVDSSFTFFDNLYINGFWATTKNEAVAHGDDVSYRANVFYNGDRYGYSAEHAAVGENFDPQVGFRRRVDFTKDRMQFRFSPRPKTRFRGVRKFTYQTSIDYFENGTGQKESRQVGGEFQIEFQSSDKIEIHYYDEFEYLAVPFRIARNVTVPSGGYYVRRPHVELQLGQQRLISGTFWAEGGAFYDGSRAAVGYSSGRVKLNPRLAVEPGFQVNRVALPWGSFTTNLATTRTTFTITPMMFVSGLMQYNSSNATFSTNLRLRWEYRPGSELFVVYNEGRDTLLNGFPDLQNRSLVFKINRLFRF